MNRTFAFLIRLVIGILRMFFGVLVLIDPALFRGKTGCLKVYPSIKKPSKEFAISLGG